MFARRLRCSYIKALAREEHKNIKIWELEKFN